MIAFEIELFGAIPRLWPKVWWSRTTSKKSQYDTQN
jgi:hypothetical protein